jgi:methionyl-tRNA formyltransferase
VRTVYLGTSDFAAAVLERLAASPHRPALVVTRPDRPKGRGRRLQSPPVAATARDLGIEAIGPEDLHAPETLERIAAAEPERLVVCAYGALVKPALLDRYEILNVHPSLLPRWRGAAPIERAIMAGDAQTGVAIMQLTEGLDSGPVGLMEPEPIHPDDDFASLSARLQARGGDLLVRALDEAPSWTEQPEEGVTYAHKLEAAHRTLAPAQDAAVLERTVRALRPHIGARLPLPESEGGGYLGVWRASSDGSGVPAGRLGVGADGALVLGAAGGTGLRLEEVQPPGGRRMAAGDWLRGRPSFTGFAVP